MNFFWDKMGLTYEGAVITSIIIISAIIGGISLVSKGIKEFIKWRKKRLLIKEIRELIPGMSPEEREELFPNWKN